jgi:TRAP-type C4-dicarboxylate transport system substrate-binding protein
MRNGKRIALVINICIIVLLISTSFLAGCSSTTTSQSTPAPATSVTTTAPATSAPTTVPTTAVKTIELRLADWNPPTSGIVQIHQKMADRIFEQSGGRLKITIYPSESLAKMNEVFRATQTGAVDIGYWVIGSAGSSTELSRTLGMPFMGIKSMQMGTYVAQKAYDTIPAIQQEWSGLKVLGFRMLPGNQGQFTKKPVSVPSDLKGMKVITSGAQWAEIISNAGAAPVVLNIGDWYTSLDKGLVEGQFTHFAVSYIFKTLDLYKYYTMIGDYGASGATDCYCFNQSVWDKLSPDLQKIVTDNIDWRTQEMMKFDIGEVQRGIDYAKSKNGVFNVLNADQIKAWQDFSQPVVQKWVNENQAKGLPAQQVYDQVKGIINSYSGQ